MHKHRQQELAAVALCLTAAVVSGCSQEAEQPHVQNAAAVVPSETRLPVVDPPMDRAGLLQAVGAAASAAALGQDDADAQRKLDGKKFEVRIRFGCASSAPTAAAAANAPFNVRFDPEQRTLRVRAAPDLTLDDPQVAKLAGQGIEAVEGFWMRRPWLLADGCPVEAPAQQDATQPAEQAAAPAAATLPSGERVGIAQFFAATDSRVGRRDHRAYEATSTLGANEQPSREGYNLVLSGRLRKLASGRVVTCRVGGRRDVPPECIVSAEFDRAWIELPQSKAIIAEWSN